MPCGKRTTFDIDNCGSILYVPLQVEDASTSGDDESDSSDDDSTEKKDSTTKANKQDKPLSDKNGEVSKHNKNARALATGSKPTPPSEAAKAQGGGARKGTHVGMCFQYSGYM